MKTTKQTLLRRLILSTLILTAFSGCASTNRYADYQVIDAVEEVTIYSETGDYETRCKIDTGALRCSIDEPLALRLGLEQVLGPFSKPSNGMHCNDEQVFVESATGSECRNVYVVPMWIANSIDVVGNCSATGRVAKGLKFECLIGRTALKNNKLLVSSDNGLTKEQEEAEEK